METPKGVLSTIPMFQIAPNTSSLMIESPLFMGQKKFSSDISTDLSTRGTLGTEVRDLLKAK